MSNRKLKKGATAFTSPAGDVDPQTAERPKITPYDLMTRLELLNIPTPQQMADAIHVDVEELFAVMDRLAQAIPRDSYQETRKSLRGILAWGVAIGYFYARQESPILGKKVN